MKTYHEIASEGRSRARIAWHRRQHPRGWRAKLRGDCRKPSGSLPDHDLSPRFWPMVRAWFTAMIQRITARLRKPSKAPNS